MNIPPKESAVQAQIVEPPKSPSVAGALAVLGGLGALAFVFFVGFVLFLVAFLVPAMRDHPTAPDLPAVAEAGMLHITDENFDAEVLNAAGPETIVVDFYADWCGPCRMQTPILAKYAADHPNVKIAKVDVDKSPGVAGRYGINSIPTLFIVKNGEIVARHVGLADENTLAALVGK